MAMFGRMQFPVEESNNSRSCRMPTRAKRDLVDDDMSQAGSNLLDAINRGKVHLAKFILDAVAPDDYEVVNTRDFKGKSPIIRCCYIKEERTRCKAVQLLLSKKANVNDQDDVGRTALSYACELRCNDMVQILVKNNVDPDIADHQGETPLMYCAKVGNDKCIDILIKSFRRLGLGIDKQNKAGCTALIVAAKLGNLSCASILALDGRACLTIRDKERGLTAEEWAREQGCSTPEVLAFACSSALKYRRRGNRAHFETYPLNTTNKSKTSLKDVTVEGSKRKVSGFTMSREQAVGNTKISRATSMTVDAMTETLTDLRLGASPLPQPISKIGSCSKHDINQTERISKMTLIGCHFDAIDKASMPQLSIQKASFFPNQSSSPSKPSSKQRHISPVKAFPASPGKRSIHSKTKTSPKKKGASKKQKSVVKVGKDVTSNATVTTELSDADIDNSSELNIVDDNSRDAIDDHDQLAASSKTDHLNLPDFSDSGDTDEELIQTYGGDSGVKDLQRRELRCHSTSA
ncbi:uncharacterized protein LOC141915347 [Tubulanus polymorphus]|uniref:uncharacterized protein LOC141915347 n=1 Tax=Tubulanus polymorphus TaxID=672921 RepID=UPI003DA500D2